MAFDGAATSTRYFGVLFSLEDLLGCSVDLVTEKALRQELRPFIEPEGSSHIIVRRSNKDYRHRNIETQD